MIPIYRQVGLFASVAIFSASALYLVESNDENATDELQPQNYKLMSLQVETSPAAYQIPCDAAIVKIGGNAQMKLDCNAP